MSDIEVKIIQNTREFASLCKDWERLLEQSPVKSAFLTWEWLFGWWKVHQENRRLWLIAAWRKGELAGVAPLMRERRRKFGLSLRAVVNLGAPQSDAGGFLFKDENVLFHLWSRLAQNREEWDMIELNEFARNGAEMQFLRGELAKTDFLWREEGNVHYFIPLEETWDKFSGRLARKFRYNLRRALRLAEEIGPVEICHYSGEQVTWEVFNTVVQINRHAHYPRLYNSQTEQALIRALIDQPQPKQGWLDVYLLRVNGEAIAYEYGFQYEKRFEDWRSGFDTRFPSNISVGKLLAMEVVQQCIREGYTEIDFLRGDETYKQEWEPLQREFASLRVFNRKSPPAVAAHLWLEKVKPLLKKQPAGQKREKAQTENQPAA